MLQTFTLCHLWNASSHLIKLKLRGTRVFFWDSVHRSDNSFHSFFDDIQRVFSPWPVCQVQVEFQMSKNGITQISPRHGHLGYLTKFISGSLAFYIFSEIVFRAFMNVREEENDGGISRRRRDNQGAILEIVHPLHADRTFAEPLTDGKTEPALKPRPVTRVRRSPMREQGR